MNKGYQPQLPRNYCFISVQNNLDKHLAIHWSGDIWGRSWWHDIAAGGNSIVPSRNIRRAGADLVFRYHIYRIRSDNTLHDIGIGTHHYQAPPIINCPDTTILLGGIADSPYSFGFYATFYYGWPSTQTYTFKVASVPLAQWVCESAEECAYS